VRVKCLAQEHNIMPRPGLEPGPLDPEASALTVRPPRLPINHVDNAAVSNRDFQAFLVQCYVLLTPAWFSEPKMTNVQAGQLPIPYPDTYFKQSYLVLTLMLGRFLSGFLDAIFEGR